MNENIKSKFCETSKYMLKAYGLSFTLLSLFLSPAIAGQFDRALDKISKDSSYYKTELSSSEKEDFKKSYVNIFDVAYGQKDLVKKDFSKREYSGFLPSDLYLEHKSLVESLYKAGFGTKAVLTSWERDFKKLKNLSAPDTIKSGISEKDFWQKQHIELSNRIISNLNKSNPGCALEGETVGHKKCCIGHVKVSSLSAKSGFKCSRIRNVGEACSKLNNICRKSSCFETDLSSVVSNKLCKLSTKKCSSNTDCCSGSCSQNKCQSVRKCTNCKSGGAKVSETETCCPGYLKLNNRCVNPVPVFVPTSVKVNKIKFKLFAFSVLKSLENTIFTSAHAAKPESNDRGEDIRREFLDEKIANCHANHPKDTASGQKCLESVDRLSTSYGEDNYKKLTEQQEAVISTIKDKCTRAHDTNSVGHISCMNTARVEEVAFLTKNKLFDSQCLANSTRDGSIDRSSDEYISCMVEKGGITKALTKEEYVDKYNIPGVTAKTYSDLKQCEFNSYNDSWRDASNKEKNAELFLRGFEYVFSHKGTQDYWVEPGKGNIFSRANKVVVKFRENRSKMLTSMREIDKTMACKCIAIFGPNEFDVLKQEFFNANCEEEKAELQAALGEDLDKGQKVARIDGTSISGVEGTTISTESTNVNSKGGSVADTDEVAEAKVEEIDKGAIGISHGKLLMDWLNLRSEAQMSRFVDNSELEAKLSELSEFISGTNFNEVFKDRVQGKELMVGQPKGDSVLLYKWGYTYRPGWMKIFNFLTFGLVENLLLNFNYKRGSAGGGQASVNSSMTAAWRYHESDDIEAAPEIIDVQTKKKSCVKKVLKVCVKLMDGYHRYFVGPRFEGLAGTGNTKCNVFGRASACFKSGYRVSFEGAVNFIVDPTLPLFVNASHVSLNKMPNQSLPFNKMLNNASSQGLKFLRSKRPRGNIKGYRKGGRKFGNQDHMAEAIRLGYFLPMAGRLKDVDFEKSKAAIIKGAEKYSMCKELNKCGASEIANDIVGFGYLFESQKEAADFGEYVYEIHYKWSHLTKNDFMGYPLAGMDQYFALAAYNMKLVGSLAATRSQNYAEAYELYKADYDKRVGDYNSLGQASVGSTSKNITYSDTFYALFSKLNFKGETNLDVFDATVKTSNTIGKLSAAEAAALSAGRDSALRRNSDVEKKKDFDRAVAGASGATKSAINSKSKELLKANNPLSQFKVGKLGGGGSNSKAFKQLSNSIDSINSDIKDLNSSKSKGQKKKNNAHAGSFSFGGGYGASSGSGSSSYSNGQSNGEVGYGDNSSLELSKDHGLSESEINGLLTNLEKDKGLDPSDEDNLFNIVSKAYKRNYSRVLVRKTSSVKGFVPEVKKGLSKDSKSELKTLLND